MWICLLCLQNFWTIYHAWIYRMLYSLARYSHSIASVRATHFTENRLCSWNPVVLLSCLSAQRSWSDRTAECPFEDSVSVPCGVTPANTTWDWRNVPEGWDMLWIGWLTHGPASSIPHQEFVCLLLVTWQLSFSWHWNNRGKKGVIVLGELILARQ